MMLLIFECNYRKVSTTEDFAWISRDEQYNVTDFRERPLGFVLQINKHFDKFQDFL